MKHSLSVIIPVLNEERTISSVIEIVRTWGKAREIIIVNDEGTTDGTIDAIRQFLPVITILTNQKKRGKGDALVLGIRKSSGNYLMFLDGDLVGLTHMDLDALFEPVRSGRADMTIGERRKQKDRRFAPLKSLGGERVVKRADIDPILDHMKNVGYGAEQLLNLTYQKKRILYVAMPHVSVLLKFEKQAVRDALQRYLGESKDVMAQFARQHANDLTPSAKRVFARVQTYLRKAFEYFQ